MYMVTFINFANENVLKWPYIVNIFSICVHLCILILNKPYIISLLRKGGYFKYLYKIHTI